VKLQVGLFLMLTGCSLGLGFWIRDRHINKPLHAQLTMPDSTMVSLPVEDYGGHLYLQGKINGKATKDMILDSGAADVFISESQAKILGLQSQGKVNIPGRSKTIPTAYVPNVSIQLGSLTLKDPNSVVIPQAEVKGLEQYFGRAISGIIGYELFEQLVVELDYQRQTLRLHRPQTYQYQGNGQRIPLVIEGDRPYISATITPYGYPALPSKLMVDLGSNAALSLTAACGLDQRLIAAAPRTLRRNLATIQGADEIVLARVQSLNIGSILLQQPTAILGKAKAEDCDRLSGKMGYQILRQFKVILDYPHRQLILEPRAQIPYDYDLSGLWLEATGPQLTQYRVGAVTKKTPAATAGVKIGDRIVQINDTPASAQTLVQIRQQLSRTGQTINLQLEREKQQFSVRLKLQPLL
jgi:Aspartyl protease/PDZ domain